MDSGIDTSVVLIIPETLGEYIASSAEWAIFDERRKAFIVTATKARIEVEFGRPEITLFLTELVDGNGEPLRAVNTGGKFGTINEAVAYTQEFLEWNASGGKEPFEGETFNLKEFRYLVHRVLNGLPPELYRDTEALAAELANPNRITL